MSAHFCAAIPNFRIMEIEIDDPWKGRSGHRAAAHRARPVNHADQARLGRRHPRRHGEEASAELIVKRDGAKARLHVQNGSPTAS
jgi:hypothetical protein